MLKYDDNFLHLERIFEIIEKNILSKWVPIILNYLK